MKILIFKPASHSEWKLPNSGYSPTDPADKKCTPFYSERESQMSKYLYYNFKWLSGCWLVYFEAETVFQNKQLKEKKSNQFK